MGERSHPGDGGRASSAVANVVLPMAILLIIIAVVAGLVFGGVVQGHAERAGPGVSPSTESTIIIEP